MVLCEVVPDPVNVGDTVADVEAVRETLAVTETVVVAEAVADSVDDALDVAVMPVETVSVAVAACEKEGAVAETVGELHADVDGKRLGDAAAEAAPLTVAIVGVEPALKLMVAFTLALAATTEGVTLAVALTLTLSVPVPETDAVVVAVTGVG